MVHRISAMRVDTYYNEILAPSKTFQIDIVDPIIRPEKIYACIYETARTDEEIQIKSECCVDCDGESCVLALDMTHIGAEYLYSFKAYQWIEDSWECVGTVNGDSQELLNRNRISIRGY